MAGGERMEMPKGDAISDERTRPWLAWLRMGGIMHLLEEGVEPAHNVSENLQILKHLHIPDRDGWRRGTTSRVHCLGRCGGSRSRDNDIQVLHRQLANRLPETLALL